VVTSGARTFDLEGLVQPGLERQLPKDALRRGRSADIAQTHEANSNHASNHLQTPFGERCLFCAQASQRANSRAALSEVLVLRPEDDAAETALAQIRTEIARRHARKASRR
jgi:hypothetical protein